MWHHQYGRRGQPVGRYSLDQVMIHEVPRGRPKDAFGAVVVSQNPTAISPETHDFICDEMLEKAVTRSRRIIEDSAHPGLVPRLAREIFDDPALLPEHSRSMVAHLYAEQAPASSAGIFVAALGKEGGAPRLILMKAEHQEGVRLKREERADGVEFVAEHINELIVGDKARVYKIAVLELNTASDTVSGVMVDLQADYYAAFFLTGFLECSVAESNEVLTRDFVNTVDKFLARSALDVEARTAIATAAAVYLDRPDDTIRPLDFTKAYIPADQRDAFEALFPASIQGNIEFRRDPGMVGPQLGGVRMSFGPDVTLISSAEAFTNETVTVTTDDDGKTQIMIRPPSPDDGKIKLTRPKK